MGEDDYMNYWEDAGYTGGGSAVVPDNSYGAPAMTTSTPTGNGSGVYLQPDSGGWGRTLQNVLNYAMVRDQQRMAQVANAPIRAVQTQAAQARAQDGRILFWLAIGVGVYMAVK